MQETLTTSKGHQVPVLRTDLEAAQVLERHAEPGSFGRDLASKFHRYGWSPRQRPWAHKLANEATGDVPQPPAPTVQIQGDLQDLVALMHRAQESLQYPKLRLALPEGDLVVSVAGGRARHPGTLNVTSPGGYHDSTWYGRIHTDGRWEPTRAGAPTWVQQALQRVAQDPAGVASASGQRSGACSFCGQQLTDERSLGVGYGPVCADNYGLPWGTAAAVGA